VIVKKFLSVDDDETGFKMLIYQQISRRFYLI
jgi:hypothetical protein